jgi:hypothetical protein
MSGERGAGPEEEGAERNGGWNYLKEKKRNPLK